MVLEDNPHFPCGRRYIYVVRNNCYLTPDIHNLCLEMYISHSDHDENILSKHKRIALHLNIPVYIDVYQEHTDNQVMLLHTTYSFNEK
jgi:hypothetical protein